MNKSKFIDLLLPFILIVEVILCFFFGDFIPLKYKSFFLSVGLTIKEVLLLSLPFVIFSLVLGSISKLKQGPKALLLILGLIITSNICSSSLGGLLGFLTLSKIKLYGNNILPADTLHPLWNIALPKIIKNEIALFLGLLLGILFSVLKNEKLLKFASGCQKTANIFLKKIFIRTLPLFILGFIMEIQHEGILGNIFKHYLTIILIIISFAFFYISFLYAVTVKFNFLKWSQSLKNIFPAMLTGFCTMSSATALPLIISGVEKSTNDSSAQGITPISVNVHLIGDSISLNVLSLALMLSFNNTLPSFSQYMVFMIFFVISKFSVAGVPGGTVLVMLPIFEKYLGFNGEMLSIITILYILFDPLITPLNIMGNGAFSTIVVNLFKKLKIT